jgi:hypothetical protein
MDLMYMNHDREDLGILKNPEFDLAFGENENNFECKISLKDHCCKEGYYIYAEGTEYGGIVDAIEIDSENDLAIYTGRSWHGILASKYIPSNFSASGDANAVLRTVLTKIDLAPLFAVTEETAGVNISHTYDRYQNAYNWLCSALKADDMRLSIVCDDRTVILSAVPVFDFSDGKEIETDLIEYQMKKTYNNVNHLICLGQGKPETRQVVHLYLDENGEVSETQTFTGVDELVSVDGEKTENSEYEETEEERTAEQLAEERANLIENGTKKLLDMQADDEIDVSFDSTDDIYYIGDIVGAYDSVTDISVSAEVVKKIVSISRGRANIEYKVGARNG